MFKKILILLLLNCINQLWSQQKLVTVNGFAPDYIGKTISFNQIQDYLSYSEALIANTTVNDDSTFSVSFEIDETQRISIHAFNNNSFIYAQPGATYDLYIPEKDPYQPARISGNNVEVTFFDLDSSDINYKVLLFQRWCDEFMSSYFHLKGLKPEEFDQQLSAFKSAAESYYSTDTSVYLKAYIMYTIATFDNIQFSGQHRIEAKYDFYLDKNPIFYNNDAYMEYFNSFYDNMMPRLDDEVNEKVYQAVLNSSPTLFMRALHNEYLLSNFRIRELVMLKSLGEEYYKRELPQTNIITILDSVSKGSMFPEHALIARNILTRLTLLMQGGKAPDFFIKSSSNEMHNLQTFSKKHLYLHFYDPSLTKGTLELEPLKKLYENYKIDVEFITIYPNKEYSEDIINKNIKSLPWKTFKVDLNNSIWKSYQVNAFPYYVLLDTEGYVVGAPAKGPLPNGQYSSIDETFFYIHKANSNR
jgi:peroxiredoxin